MNSGLQDSGQTGREKKPSTSDITEKSSQPPKESVMQSQSEMIRRQAQEMQSLSSENSVLKKKLQEQSAEIVSLNEQIGKLCGADLVLKQNEELERKNSELRKNAQGAEERAEAVKASYARKEEKLQKKLARAEELEQDMSRKNAEMDRRISDLADERIADAKRSLQQDYRYRLNREQDRYQLLRKECKEEYDQKAAADVAFTWGCLLYAILATVFTGVKSDRFSHDAIEVIAVIGKFIIGLGETAWSLGKAAWSLHTQIQVPVLQVIVPAILAVLSYMAVIGLVTGFFGFIGYKFVYFYKEHFADCLSVYEAIIELTVIVWFADGLTFVKLNLVIVLAAIHMIYIFIRMVVSMERDGRILW